MPVCHLCWKNISAGNLSRHRKQRHKVYDCTKCIKKNLQKQRFQDIQTELLAEEVEYLIVRTAAELDGYTRNDVLRHRDILYLYYDIVTIFYLSYDNDYMTGRREEIISLIHVNQ